MRISVRRSTLFAIAEEQLAIDLDIDYASTNPIRLYVDVDVAEYCQCLMLQVWGVPVHDDKKLFELLILSTALAELSWPAILNKRHMFREVFMDFDPIAVSKLNEKRTVTPGSAASALLLELKLQTIIENTCHA
ncbi:DNA-3-methyladenine glycosylase 1 [Camellia lanceoleosa]|uniref:DNA-3-methyladenine glycosylase 1 n=1 Tax=Camellia lanceoleosa TaxID=1840588 RepID=A0ACC0I3R1_9ERIC|nr:DNA-3-methyladenine glycosylase 1 [Camellia lanceoleosa]